MRHHLFILILFVTLASCGGSKSSEDCKSTAGTQWSALNKNCVTLSDVKFKLKPQEAATDKTGMAYLVFNSSSNKAEALLPGNESTGILVRSDDIKPWMNAVWTLEIKSGYVLKKDGIVMYAE
ncbi:MAG: hypothetical protein V9F01_04880 [Chitinophagaceae bacterium]